MTGGYEPDNQWNGILTVQVIENKMDDGSKTFQLFRRSTVEPFFGDNYDYSGEKHNRFTQSLHVVEDPSSQAAFDRAAKWLAHCVENDKACEPPDDDFMPTHLIHVGSASQSPFLFRTTETRQPYACLSYCWGPGSDAILKTTTSNIEDHYQKIPELAMPEAIRDAVRVCRGLKIQFLWVDSLCLIQDDTEAWLTGAAQMSQIYLNSYLTIAALEPGTCRAPFLGPQKFGDRNWQWLVRPVALDEAVDQGHDLLIRPNSDASPRDAPYSLDKRAWCLQESMLPNRRLCFDGNEMIWECLCRQLCECGHTIRQPLTIRHVENEAALKVNRLKATPILSDPRPLSLPRDHVSEYSATWGDIRKMRTTWRRLVGVYSRRQMTRGDDKLRAIAGLAKILAERFNHEGVANNNDEYLAGLWKHEIYLDLFWVVTSLPFEPENMASRSGGEGPRWNVPTWSWALAQVELLAEVESTETLGAPHHFQMRITRDQDCAGRVAWARFSNQKVNGVLLDHQKHRVGLQEGASRESVVGAAGEYYCFRIFSWVADTGEVYDGERQFMGPETWFLVLKKSQRVKGAMERIGIGSAEASDSKPYPAFEAYEETTISIV